MIFLSIGCAAAHAQTNSWTSPSSGNWEDLSSWSLGILPGTNQTVMLTNSGFKAVQISPTTAQNFPQSLNVNSVVISSPSNSFNTLLMNFAGPARPLNVQSLSVGSNSAMTMLSSGLQLIGPESVGMTIGGQFNQTDSVVAGNQINVGYIGPGVYDFNTGILEVSNLWVGGPYDGVFYQSGGTNGTGTTHLDGAGGEYVLSNGVYNAMTYFDGGTFQQEGGQLNTEVYIFEGNYVLAGGILEGPVYVPGTDGINPGNGTVLQTGGTNYGSIEVGTYGAGTYTFSNGVANGDDLAVDYEGTLTQWGGMIAYPDIYINYRQVGSNTYQFGTLVLNGGQMQAYYSMTIFGNYVQNGGTNVTDDLEAAGSLSLSGGLLEANFIEGGGISLSGGTLLVSSIDVDGNGLLPRQGFYMSGGQLIVTNITMMPASSFVCTGGTVSQQGTLSLSSANLYVGSTPVSFGPLQVTFSPGYSDTNRSMLVMPAGASIVRFADSSGLQWAQGLNVENWNGSLTGGGQQQIIFGTSAGGLTAQQLGVIQFHNPVGFPPGYYPARILSDGEIVPVAGTVALSVQMNRIQLTIQGRTGSNYIVEASTDLVHWTELIDEVDTNGTLTIIDTNSLNFPFRFYRTELLP